jgi:putative CocE/NonD family hydrolase
MRPRGLLSAFALICALLAPQAARSTEAPVDLLWGVRIPLRDGVEVNATVYLPGGRPGGPKEPLPVVFTLTPYTADSYHERGMYFARHGYVFALVDVRGRGNSGGKFDPFVNEGKDGHDIVEWLARQPWSNGKVTMWGGSYAGYDQWVTLREAPPHLATIVPVASPYPGVDFPISKNIFTSYDMQWLTYTSGLTGNRNLFGEGSFWSQKAGEMYRGHRPYRELDRIVGNTGTVFQTWLAHPTPDAHWQAMAATPQQTAAMNVPILTITGAYDGDQPGALTWYRQHMQHASAEAKKKHYLVIGPWDHAGTRTPTPSVGGLAFGEASLLDLNDLHRQWYDWTMKGGPQPSFLKKRVAWYISGPGAEEWRYADTLEGVAGGKRTLYLGSDDGRAGDVFESGRLAAGKPAQASTPDRWTYDPLHLREEDEDSDDAALLDQRYPLRLDGEGVVYHSEPLAEPLEIAGEVKLAVWLAMDVPDTDLQALLYEIRPDGSSVLLTADLLRARYRESLEKETLVKSGDVLRYDFTGFSWFARRLQKGSRLRLVVASINSPAYQKNYNSGGVVADESAKDARTAHIQLWHDAEHPSALEIPVAGGGR